MQQGTFGFLSKQMRSILFVISILSCTSVVCVQYSIHNAGYIFLIILIECILYFQCCRKSSEKRARQYGSIYSIMLGCAVSLCNKVHYTQIHGTSAENYININVMVWITGLATAFLIYPLFYLINVWIQNNQISRICIQTRKLSQRSFFFLVWMLILLCWIPFVLTFFPGGIVNDGARALEYALDPLRMTNKWVVVNIILLRLCLSIGYLFSNSIETGIFVYTSFLALLYASGCAAVVTELRKRNTPVIMLVIFVMMYCISGHFAAFATCMWRDGLFATAIIYLSLILWRFSELRDEINKPLFIQLALVILFLCFWRNNVAYLVLVAGLVFLFIKISWHRIIAIILIGVSAVSIFVQGPLYRKLQVEENSVVESVAIPIQQIAATISSGVVVSDTQTEVLYKMLPREKWIQLYCPTICDDIKFSIDGGYFKNHMVDFLRVWLELLPKNIPIYIRAHLLQTLGFWQPYGSNRGNYYDYFIGVEDLFSRGYHKRNLILEATGYSLEQNLLRTIPFIPSGTVVWIMLLSVFLILCQKRERKTRLLVLFPFLTCWIIVMFSAPIAYAYRYVEMLAIGLPLFLMIPFMSGSAMEQLQIKNDTGTNGSVHVILSPDRLFSKPNRKSLWFKPGCLLTVFALFAFTFYAITYIQGIASPHCLSSGPLFIDTTANGNTKNAYCVSGLSTPEQTFTWTDGHYLYVEVPLHDEINSANIEIEIQGTFAGKQNYYIFDSNEKVIHSGFVEGKKVISFPIAVNNHRINFKVFLPDAVRISEIIHESGDDRIVALQISGITITAQD